MWIVFSAICSGYLYNFAKEGTKRVAEQATKTASAIQKTVEEKVCI